MRFGDFCRSAFVAVTHNFLCWVQLKMAATVAVVAAHTSKIDDVVFCLPVDNIVDDRTRESSGYIKKYLLGKLLGKV